MSATDAWQVNIMFAEAPAWVDCYRKSGWCIYFPVPRISGANVAQQGDEPMKPSKTLLFSLTLCLLSWSCQQQPASFPDTRAADEAALRTADIEWSKAAGAKDLDRSISYTADDTVMLAPNAPAASGKEAVRKSWSDMLALPGLVLSWQPTKRGGCQVGRYRLHTRHLRDDRE